MTLLEALSAKKKDTGMSGEATALIRHAVAAYLNALHPCIDGNGDGSTIIAGVQSAFASDYFDYWHGEFERWNEMPEPDSDPCEPCE
jgi:hypothetical protein